MIYFVGRALLALHLSFAFVEKRKMAVKSVKFVTRHPVKGVLEINPTVFIGVLFRVLQQLALYCNNRAICGKQHRYQRDKIHQRRLTRSLPALVDLC